jgi:protein TonB
LALKRFFLLSLAVHAVIITVIFLAPSKKEEEKKKEFFATLIEEPQAAPVIPVPSMPKAPSIKKPLQPPKSRPPARPQKPSPEEKPDEAPKTLSGKWEGKKETAPEKAPKPLSESGSGDKTRPLVKGDGRMQLPGQTSKEKIFDRDVIEQFARRQEEKRKEKEKEGITFDTSELKYYGYMQRLKEKIEGIWVYPPGAIKQGLRGELVIRFEIKGSGRLGDVEVLQTSGFKALDDAAVKALHDAEPYWPLPGSWGKEGLVITGRFIYALSGYYIR